MIEEIIRTEEGQSVSVYITNLTTFTKDEECLEKLSSNELHARCIG